MAATSPKHERRLLFFTIRFLHLRLFIFHPANVNTLSFQANTPFIHLGYIGISGNTLRNGVYSLYVAIHEIPPVLMARVLPYAVWHKHVPIRFYYV